MSLHDEAVARFIIEQGLIHRSETRRAMSGVRVLGEGEAIPFPKTHGWWRPTMGLGIAVNIPSGVVGPRKAQPPNRCPPRFCLKVVSLVSCAQVILTNMGEQNFHFGGIVPKCPSLATGLKNTALYHLESPYRYAISDYYNR